MPFWTYQNLANLTQGTWLVAPADDRATLPAALNPAGPILWHDTREITAGQCYLAIAGENFDGNRFVPQAFAAGAALAIVDSESAVSDQLSAFSQNPQPVLLVEDSVKALQQLARAYRRELSSSNTSGCGGCKVIGIAGSNGKTTTRHLIHHVLTHAGKTGTQSPKSFNNHLGVPLTLLAARPTDDFVACEIGTNHPGEIDFLSEIAKPDIAVITSIGEEHLEFFKNIRNVAKEEACILDHVIGNRMAIAPEYDLERYLRKLVRREDISLVAGWYKTESKQERQHLFSMGEHMLSNASLAGSVAELFEIQTKDVDEAVSKFKPPTGRCERLRLDGLTIIHDAYNANPSSTQAAIEMLNDTDSGPVGRKVMVFGDMLELGEQSEQAHRKIGGIAFFWKIGVFITIGQEAKYAAIEVDLLWESDPPIMDSSRTTVHRFGEWSDDLPDQIATLLQPGDTVLLKASRGMRLERLIPAIEKRFGKAEG